MPPLDDLETLLSAPSEALSVEYKTWLNLKDNEDQRGLLAKAAIALANEGGGSIVLGFSDQRQNLVSEARPAEIPPYDQDTINQIIHRYASPPFHCTLQWLKHKTTNVVHPVITIPGGFASPVMSKSASPNNAIRAHVCYVRKPGPLSEEPKNHAEWDGLLSRCLRNRRQDMIDAIRTIMEGAGSTSSAPVPGASDLLDDFITAADNRWSELISPQPPNADARFPLGAYTFSYALVGDFDSPSLNDLLTMLRGAQVKYSGWPQFCVPARQEIAPVAYDDLIECWLGDPNSGRVTNIDAGHADFWRASPVGRFYLKRGYIEDTADALNGRNEKPGSVLDASITIKRLAELMLHACSLNKLIAPNPVDQILFRLHWSGLKGRKLTCLDSARIWFGEYVCHQPTYEVDVLIDPAQIRDNLPELIHPVLAGFYERFSFFKLDMRMVAEDVKRMMD